MKKTNASRYISMAVSCALLMAGLLASPPAFADSGAPSIEPREIALTDASATLTEEATDGKATTTASDLASGTTVDGSAIVTGQIDVSEFTVAALTWDAGDSLVADNAIYIRVREASGWSDWSSVDALEAPQSDSAGGSDPFISGIATGVQVQVTGDPETLPAGLTLVVAELDSDGSTSTDPRSRAQSADKSATQSGTTSEGRAGIAAGIHPRSDWDGGSAAPTWDEETATLQAAIVHHTAGTNNYAQADVPGIIAGIYYYHAITLGWGDIGYNFLVDKYGGLWEGREGSLDVSADSMVVGGHAYGYNTGTMGVSALGDFTTADPGSGIIDGYATIISYRFDLAGLDARDVSGFTSLSGASLPRIFGHRDVYATECPGYQVYRQLPDLIQRVGAPKISSFIDVPVGTQFYDEIMWLANKEVTTGWLLDNGDREFRPVQPVARDAMAAFLYRLAGSPEYSAPDISLFTDVPTDSQFYKEISWLAEMGISTGWDMGDGTKQFRPLESVARDAMAAFLYRYADVVLNEDVASFVPDAISPFSDIDTDNQFYRQISWLADEKISTGWPVGDLFEFRGLEPVNRDAMAAFMYRLVNR
ncbi:hypothetical protein SDC9_95331 [bioreactor metagenome]|uniref:SLH domain-containing protein n=1 Tax=bioreactor metagenome TaxID=1076179 RepID=A0A645A5Z6_9ZZZZ